MAHLEEDDDDDIQRMSFPANSDRYRMISWCGEWFQPAKSPYDPKSVFMLHKTMVNLFFIRTNVTIQHNEMLLRRHCLLNERHAE